MLDHPGYQNKETERQEEEEEEAEDEEWCSHEAGTVKEESTEQLLGSTNNPENETVSEWNSQSASFGAVTLRYVETRRHKSLLSVFSAA